jgi:hypothetical protein
MISTIVLDAIDPQRLITALSHHRLEPGPVSRLDQAPVADSAIDDRDTPVQRPIAGQRRVAVLVAVGSHQSSVVSPQS